MHVSSAVAAASPTPSPSLQTVLVGPTRSEFVEAPSGQHDGPMSAAEYAGNDSTTLTELQHDGYVVGFVRTWIDESRKHVLVEAVVAFGGRRDAAKWLASVKAHTDDQFYVHPISVDGVDSYFGRHYADPTQPAYTDLGVFLKGNDFFFVGVSSKADDLGDVAAAQTKKQYDAAPPYSIAPSQWPENGSHSMLSLGSAALPIAVGAASVLVVGILAMVLATILLARRRPRTAAVSAATAGALQMSDDGRYWWDGQSWRDASREVPPGAMRSTDGYYWWDSRTWRPVPPAGS